MENENWVLRVLQELPIMLSFSSTLGNGFEINAFSRSTHHSTGHLFRTAGGPQAFLSLTRILVRTAQKHLHVVVASQFLKAET